ncbi:MAG: BtpA/SgcQ family protein [Myxococcales bacterium]|nr:BtpA/SgcQ family protein [Myxococcales bacterium]MCB9641664.1 BtpA/SgcQ family protein [Myxococcales bacterium]
MRYLEYLKKHKDLIAMIHLPALPGTPQHALPPSVIVHQAVKQAQIYKDAGVRTVMIENMHDIPYTRSVGPEITALMAVIGHAIKQLGLYCGIQILAACNKEALAAAHAAGMDFIRAEGFVFGHVADEGYIDSCAGDLLRYRRNIGAENIAIFTDIKKKHSSHAITADVSLKETEHAAEFFLSDGVIITGNTTGDPVDVEELRQLGPSPTLRLLGSGVTPDNLPETLPYAQGFIVGSWLKYDGHWTNDPDPERIKVMLSAFQN